MNPLGVSHLDHVSVIITDVARARDFYGVKLGLNEIPAPKSFDFVAIWYDLGGTYLHLLLKPEADTISPRHFCMHVKDAAAARIYLHSQGIKTDETVRIPTADRFFIRDPDGNRIELLQWESPYLPERDGCYRV
jgi:glyoxylase I family protein